MAGGNNLTTISVPRAFIEPNTFVSLEGIRLRLIRGAAELEGYLGNNLVSDVRSPLGQINTEADKYIGAIKDVSIQFAASLNVPLYLLDTDKVDVAALFAASVNEGRMRQQKIEAKGAVILAAGDDQSDLVDHQDWFEGQFSMSATVSEYLKMLIEGGHDEAAQKIFEQMFFPPLRSNNILIIGAKGDRELMARLIKRYPTSFIIPLDRKPIDKRLDLPPNSSENIQVMIDGWSVSDAINQGMIPRPLDRIYAMFPNHGEFKEFSEGISRLLGPDGVAYVVTESEIMAEELKDRLVDLGLEARRLEIPQVLMPKTLFIQFDEAVTDIRKRTLFMVAIRRPRGVPKR